MGGVLGSETLSSDNAVIVTHQWAYGVTVCDVISAIGLCGMGTKHYRLILVMCACFLITQLFLTS